MSDICKKNRGSTRDRERQSQECGVADDLECNRCALLVVGYQRYNVLSTKGHLKMESHRATS